MFNNYKDILTVDEACAALSIGKNSIYKLLKTGTIKSIKIGRKYIIPKIYLIDYINRFR
ncbi:MAG: helix-turn-helix domain-containing protein [Oscillospiraceae bacterium]|nr:helix-turn-helix domain-containing protein [Oscillospiraceae bacterium]